VTHAGNLKRCLHICMTGTVQGVCFRYYAKREAERLGVTGYVRNLPGGRVETLICGNAKQLDHMQQWLSHGPEMAHVDDLKTCEATPEHFPDSFRII